MKVAALGALLAIGASTAANAQSFDPDRKLEVFTTSALKATLAELGAMTIDQPGKQNITVQFSNGLQADALLMACTDQSTSTGCRGTSILVNYTTPDDVTAEQVRSGINEYNYRQNFGRAYLDPNGKISVRFYLISDGGITMENYRQNIGLFEVSAAKLADYVYN
tara:strand:- start:659 stop:1153 length:495 start_codon:yes stop_codon:yes gene_type:complete